MERTLIILKPSALERGILGEVISRFEKKGLYFTGLKMMQLSDDILVEHYSHLADKPFFPSITASMKRTPVIIGIVEGKDSIRVVRQMTGVTNGREAAPGTIRGDYSMSRLENIIHASDSPESALTEINRFFSPEEIFSYQLAVTPVLYTSDELL
ncbi:nucleoside-diphosphate kinase [Paludibacter jiangxiensis]|uniref:Nucleoside diphosphate kinase n=1 Tax=Paludibacter jiangxiensis TaxID=681398 RepID=A0A170Z7T4_9BACT|nr:nucleoside-diphosphate kinase [Paludibacter jiangxiensis]GAT62403.1 nucleoside-diphosphate kinase [Paludibacter jiangxiensis]